MVDDNYEFEERAAILEYDGGLAREAAEAQAQVEIEARKKQRNGVAMDEM